MVAADVALDGAGLLADDAVGFAHGGLRLHTLEPDSLTAGQAADEVEQAQHRGAAAGVGLGPGGRGRGVGAEDVLRRLAAAAEEVEEGAVLARHVAGLQQALGQRVDIPGLDQLGVEILGVVAAEAEAEGAGHDISLAPAGQADHADQVGVAGAIDQLPAGDAASQGLAGDLDQPAVVAGGDPIRQLIEAEPDARLDGGDLGEDGIERAVDTHLVMPVRAGHGDVGQAAAVEFDGAADQVPADAGNDLPAVGVEQAGEGDAAEGHGPAELRGEVDQHGRRAGAGGGDRGDTAGGAPADDEDLDVVVESFHVGSAATVGRRGVGVKVAGWK